METVLTISYSILTIYCITMYLIGFAMFADIAQRNKGIDVNDLHSLGFWGLVGIVLISPISIPFLSIKGSL